MSVVRAAFWVIVVLVVIGVGWVFWLGRPAEIAAIARPDSNSFDRAQIQRGQALAGIGDCATCHTSDGGQPFAGGRALPTPFGVIYTTNITPDRDTGIGGWSKEAFRRALREGVSRDGKHLYPAFPYDRFTKAADDDLDAIYAYLMGAVAPVAQPARANGLSFPFNIRQTLAVWKGMFLDKGPMQPDRTKDAEWNRGAYLVEGLGHCGSCHSPRNFMGAESGGTSAYGGGSAEGWHAPALNKDSPAPVAWTKTTLINYLMDGWERNHGVAGGPMTPVDNFLHETAESDVFAIATYVTSLRTSAKPADEQSMREARIAAEKREWGHPEVPALPNDAGLRKGAQIFQEKCVQCHRAGGATVPLALTTALNAPEPGNAIQTTLNGIQPPRGVLGRSMPPFATQISDADMASLMRFIRARYTTRPAWDAVDKAIAEARHTGH